MKTERLEGKLFLDKAVIPAGLAAAANHGTQTFIIPYRWQTAGINGSHIGVEPQHLCLQVLRLHRIQ